MSDGNKISNQTIWWPSKSNSPESSGLNSSLRSSKYWDKFLNQLENPDPLRINNLRKSSLEILNLIPDPKNWRDNPSPYSGMVVGAIQSGKTESMIAISAMAFDQGYKIVIVLTGNNDALRQQTALRFNTQLMHYREMLPNSHSTIPFSDNTEPIGFTLPYDIDVNGYHQLTRKLRQNRENNLPVLIVVKKENSNLEALGNHLRNSMINRDQIQSPLPLMVIDDECDEASVSNSTQSNGNRIPKAIENIWKTNSNILNVTYIGYTATAAANLLQDVRNPLYPDKFTYLLPYPSENDTSLSWRQPEFNNWYSGGDIFYDRFGINTNSDENFLVKNIITPNEAQNPKDNKSLYQALIAYFISGAFKLAIDENKGFGESEILPDPHCMLVQCSQSTSAHKKWRDAIKEMLDGDTQNDNSTTFDREKLFYKMIEDEEYWEKWFQDFSLSHNRLNQEFRGPTHQTKPISWTNILDKLPEVFEHTKLKIVNSDSGDKSDLHLTNSYSEDGKTVIRDDTFVIIVGGQRLSRGITIPGLAITYFSRESVEESARPYADTTLQLSRWFGYRGNMLEFCRLFVTEKTYNILLDINDNDYDYRLRLCSIMKQAKTLSDARIALRETPSYRLTAKIGPQAIRSSNDTGKLTFSPYSQFFTKVDSFDFVSQNEKWAASLINNIRKKEPETLYSEMGTPKALLSRNWRLNEIADILDSLVLTGHNPNNASYPSPELFKEPDPNRPIESLFDFDSDPYVVAAYLRFWYESTRHKHASFNIAIPYGTSNPDLNEPPFNLPLHEQIPSHQDHQIRVNWGTSRFNKESLIRSDNPLSAHIDDYGFREENSPGLLLLYICKKTEEIKYHIPSLGISIPKGGPTLQVVSNFHLGT